MTTKRGNSTVAHGSANAVAASNARTLRRRPGVAVTAFAAVFALLADAAAEQRPDPKVADEARPTIVVGKVTEDPRKNHPRLKQMADYLAAKLSQSAVGGVVMTKDNAGMIRHLRDGTVDLISETPLSAIRLAEEAGAEILLRESKSGVSAYRTVFFTRTDSPIASLADLRGRTVGFEDPGSTSAFLIPLALLRSQGLETVELSSPRDMPPPDKVGYAFAYGELNLVTWVENGLVAAAAFSDVDWQTLDRTPTTIKAELEIFSSSGPIIRSLILAGSALSPDKKAKVTRILLAMHDDPAAVETLRVYYGVTQYDEIDAKITANLRALDELRAQIIDVVGE